MDRDPPRRGKPFGSCAGCFVYYQIGRLAPGLDTANMEKWSGLNGLKVGFFWAPSSSAGSDRDVAGKARLASGGTGAVNLRPGSRSSISGRTVRSASGRSGKSSGRYGRWMIEEMWRKKINALENESPPVDER
jgi:hypothetical protein